MSENSVFTSCVKRLETEQQVNKYIHIHTFIFVHSWYILFSLYITRRRNHFYTLFVVQTKKKYQPKAKCNVW